MNAVATAHATGDRGRLLRFLGMSILVHLVLILVTSIPWFIGLAGTAVAEPPTAPAAPTADAPAAPADPPAAVEAAPVEVKPSAPASAQDAYLDRLPPPTPGERTAVEDFRPDLDALR